MSEKRTKRVQSRDTETVISENGEVIEQVRNISYIYGREESFVKLYVERGLVMLKGITRGQALIAFALAQRMGWADTGQRIYVNASMKRDIAAQIGCEPGTVSQAIKRLVKVGILEHVDRGCYAMNPYVFARGNWEDVVDLRTTINWADGTFATEVKFKDDQQQPDLDQ